MKMVPVFKCSDMKQAIAFYTGVLDFNLKYEEATANDEVVELENEGVEIQLTLHESRSLFGSVVNLFVDNVDGLFSKYRGRGLDTSGKVNSPVHQGPVDQSWGNREFYVTDVDGNTLRFCQPFPMPRAVFLKASSYAEGRLMNLPVSDVDKAVSFYTNVMNFKKIIKTDDPVPTIILGRDFVRMAIAENGGDSSQEGSFFEVDDVAKIMRELQLNGMKKDPSEIGIEKHGETDWKIFYLLAPDGLCYCFGEKAKADI